MRQLVRPSHVFVVLAAVVLAGLVLLAVRQQSRYLPVPPYHTVRRLAEATERGARVIVSLERDRTGTMILAATFAPLDATSHVYSRDLSPEGIDGAGRPTLLAVPAQPALHAIGPLTADQPVTLRRLEGFSAPFPLYPDGPVTLRLPVEMTAADGASEAAVEITYMVCGSAGFCLPPVLGKRIIVSLNGERTAAPLPFMMEPR